MLHRLVTALLLLAASPASGGALEEPWLGVYRDPDGLTIFMRQVVTKEPGMISARSAEEAAAPDPEEAERYKGLALDAEGRYQGLQ